MTNIVILRFLQIIYVLYTSYVYIYNHAVIFIYEVYGELLNIYKKPSYR